MAIPFYDITPNLPCVTFPLESKHTKSKKYLGYKALTGYVYATLNFTAKNDEETNALHTFWRVDCNYGLEAFIIKMPLFGFPTGDMDYLVQFVDDFVTNKGEIVTTIKMKVKVISPVTLIYNDDGYYVLDNNGDYVYNGIDRIDNNKGYTIDNIVPCCAKCNYAKGKLTLQEFKELIEGIYNHRFNDKKGKNK